MRKLARQRGLEMDPSVVSAIASAVAEPHQADGQAGGSFRDIEGAMARVDAFYRLLNRQGDRPASGPVTMLVVQQALGVHGSSSRPAGPVRVESVIQAVCEHLGVGSADFSGRGRHRKVVLARALVVLLARRLTTASFPEIARAMHRPNHSSIITAMRRIERQIAGKERVAVGCPSDGLTIEALADHLASRLRAGGREGAGTR